MSNTKSFDTCLYSSYVAYYWNQFYEDLNIPDKGFTNTNRRKGMFFILIQANLMNILNNTDIYVLHCTPLKETLL